MLYKYCNIKGLDILENVRLKTATYESLNDPFELTFGIDIKTAFDKIQQEYADNKIDTKAWVQILEERNIKYDATSTNNFLRKIAECAVYDFKISSQALTNNWKNNLGFICLSESFDVIQMWSHYADNHQGIVVGLDENMFVNDNNSLIKVQYQDEMPLIPITATTENFDRYESYIYNILKTKESNWKYENEIRIYTNIEEQDTDGQYYIKIPKLSIKNIYLGLRSDEATEKDVRSLKQRKEYSHLKIFRMVKDESEFKLIPKEL